MSDFGFDLAYCRQINLATERAYRSKLDWLMDAWEHKDNAIALTIVRGRMKDGGPYPYFVGIPLNAPSPLAGSSVMALTVLEVDAFADAVAMDALRCRS